MKLLSKLAALLTWRADDSTVARFNEYRSNILALTIEEARNRGLQLIENADKFAAVQSADDNIRFVDRLDHTILELFQKYRRIESVDTTAYIAREMVGVFQWNDGYIIIGQESDGNPVLIRANDPRIFVPDGDISNAKRIEFDPEPSIYHWLLLKDVDQYDL